MAEHYNPGLKCPWCGEPNDGAMNSVRGEHSAPKLGDYTVCVYCAQPCEHTVVGLSRVRMQDVEVENRPELERAMWLIRSAPAELRVPPSKRGIV